MWITHGRKELRLYELRDAVVTDHNVTDISGLEKQREKYTMADIIDTCRGLLVSEDKDDRYHLGGWAFVRPVHFSLVEFLRKHPSVALSNFDILRNPMDVEAELAQICLQHLRYIYLADGPASSFSELRLRLAGKNQPFAWYCAKFFDEHAAEALLTPELEQGLESLLMMDGSCLAALAQLRHMRRPNIEMDFDYFDRDINSRTIVETSRLSEIPFIRDDSSWKALDLHPHSIHQACAEGNAGLVKRLLEMVSEPHAPNSSGETPFQIAILRRHLDVVRVLLQAGADVNQTWSNGNTALEIISSFGDALLLRLLLEHGAKGLENDCSFNSALGIAVLPRRESTAGILVSLGAIPKEDDFFHAAEYGMAEVVEAGLRSGIDPNGKVYRETPPQELLASVPSNIKCQPSDTRPLYCAAKWGWTAVVQVLLEYGADANLVGGSMGAALQAAAFGGRLEIVQLLLRHGALIDQVVGSHGTALSAAASNGQDRVVRELLNAGADVNTPEGQFGCPLVASVEFDETMGCSEYVHKSGALYPNLFLERTIKGGEHNVTELLIEAGANILDHGAAALSKAAEKGFKRLVNLLLAHGARFDPAALDRAIWTGDEDIAKIALNHGADPNKADEKGHIPLLKAINGGNVDLVQILVEAGADPNLSAVQVANSETWTTRPLHVACNDGNLSMVKILLENGADPNLLGAIHAGEQLRNGGYQCRMWQGPALHAACAGGSDVYDYRDDRSTEMADVVSLLLEYDARFNEGDELGWTPLELACSRFPSSAVEADHDPYKIASTLINAGADVFASSSTHQGPLEAAARHGWTEMVELLLKKGVNDDVSKQCALQVAAEHGGTEIVKLLIDAGVDVGVPRASGSFVRENDKPIHSAARSGNCNMVKMLIDAGARLDDRGHYGTVYETMLVGLRLYEYARKSGDFVDLVRLLRSQSLAEPTETCHYGFLCNGPQCSGPGDSSYYRSLRQRIDAKPDAWICGTRYECCECEDFNLCSGCNDIFSDEQKMSTGQDTPSNVRLCSTNDSSDTPRGDSEVPKYLLQHSAHHKTKRFDTREHPDTEIAQREDDEHAVYRKADALEPEKLELGTLWRG